MGNEKPVAAAPKFQIYNSETGELLGRSAGSWAKISLFYVAYFAFLAGLFTASIQIMKTSIDPDMPKLQTRLNIPGLHFFPKINPLNTTQTDRLKDNEQIAFFWDSENEKDTFYEDIIAKEFDTYDKMAQRASSGAAGADKNQDVKTFPITVLDNGADKSCTTFPYGWDSSEPCIYLRLNRIIGWTPVGLFAPEADTLFAKDGPKTNMIRDAVYIRCEAKKLGSEDDAAPNVAFKYYGNNDGAITSDFFPYQGKSLQPDYQSPMVAIKVTGMEDGEKYRVKCQAFAKNIVIDERDNLGSIKFEIQHKGDATKTE